MSCVAGLARDGKVYMAADTGAFNNGRVYHDGGKLFTLPIGPSKTRRVLFGCVGRLSVASMVRRHLKVSAAPSSTEDLLDWLAALAEAICELGSEAKPPQVEEGSVQGEFLVGFRGELWSISQLSAARVNEGYVAIGQGGDVATGYLYGSHLAGKPETIVGNAVRAAVYHCESVAITDAGPQLLSL